MYSLIHQCPVCEHALHVTRLECSHCETTIENHFNLSKFATLSKDQLHFVEVFLVSRGNIKEVEKTLNISYPTVRAKLNEVIAKLGCDFDSDEKTINHHRKREIIALLESGEISADEAIKQLKNEEE